MTTVSNEDEISTDAIDALLKTLPRDDEAATSNGELDLTQKPLDSVDDESVDAADATVDADKETDKKVSDAVDTQAADKNTVEKADVIAKDGKHTIPYSVLEGTRNRAEQAEALAKEQADKLEALQEQLNAQQASKETTVLPEVELLTEDELEVLAEEMPTIATQIRAQQEQLKLMQAQVDKANNLTQTFVERQQEQAVLSVRDAIDQNPKLAHIEANEQALWEEAKAIDLALRNIPKFASMSLIDRFDKVVSMLEADRGEIKIPSLQNEEATVKDAVAKVKDVSIPKSLSDLPSGKADSGVNDDLSNATSAEIGQRMQKMDANQILAFIKED